LSQVPMDQRHASPMIRFSPALPALLACALWPLAAQAQEPDQVINVYFQPLEGGEFNLLNKAIQGALSEPPFQLAGKPFAGAVVVTVPGKVEVTRKKITGTYYDFTVAFTRDGSSLGQSAQSCSDRTLSDCTDQLVQDVKSVAAPK
jgi:hypothetical protein